MIKNRAQKRKSAKDSNARILFWTLHRSQKAPDLVAVAGTFELQLLFLWPRISLPWPRHSMAVRNPFMLLPSTTPQRAD